MHTHTRQAAWCQDFALVAACIAIAGTLGWRMQRPFDRDTLAIQVGRLQSHAAEAQLLVDDARNDRLAPGFVRQHALQLADRVDAVDGKLHKPAQPPLDAIRLSAQRLGESLHGALLQLGRDGRRPRTQSLGFDGLSPQFKALHAQLKPEDGRS